MHLGQECLSRKVGQETNGMIWRGEGREKREKEREREKSG